MGRGLYLAGVHPITTCHPAWSLQVYFPLLPAIQLGPSYPEQDLLSGKILFSCYLFDPPESIFAEISTVGWNHILRFVYDSDPIHCYLVPFRPHSKVSRWVLAKGPATHPICLRALWQRVESASSWLLVLCSQCHSKRQAESYHGLPTEPATWTPVPSPFPGLPTKSSLLDSDGPARSSYIQQQ